MRGTDRTLTRVREGLGVEPGTSHPEPARSRVALLLVVGLAVLTLAGAVGIVLTNGGSSLSASQVSSSTTYPVPPTVSTTIPVRSPVVASPDAPVGVGVVTLDLVDPTRSTEPRGSRPFLDHRDLHVTVRYPANQFASADEYPDAIPLGPAPLLVFAHGYDIDSASYSALLHDVAASGFVVAAVEFPLSSTWWDGPADESDIPNQAGDISYVITALTELPLAAPLDRAVLPGRIGVFGHSDGAVTALLAGYAPRFVDTRIGAVVSMSGAINSFGGTWFTRSSAPLLAIHGEWDEINPFYSSEELVSTDPFPAMLVGVQESSHLGAVVQPWSEPAVAQVTSYFFSWRLSNEPGAESDTYRVATTPPLDLIADHP